jgi:DNA-binding protein Fis
MHEAKKDTQRALAAAKTIFDGRDPVEDYSSILVTVEHTIATVLLAIFRNDPAKAAAMLNEGLIPGIESRLSLYASKSV